MQICYLIFLSYFLLLVAITPPLDSKEIKPVNPKRNKSWIFIGRTDAEVPKLWPPQAKSQLIGKDLDAGKDWRQKEKGVTEEEMVRRHHWLSVHKFEQAPGDGEAQGSLVCCSPRGLKELDTTEWLNSNSPAPPSCVPVPIRPISWHWLCGSPTLGCFTAVCYSLTNSHSYILWLEF